MPELYLMRHAKAKQARGDMTDHQRPLSRRGERQAAAMAQALRGWNALSGKIHVSSAQRTRETLEGVEAQLSETLTERAAFHDTLYTFDKQPLLEWLRERPAEVERVLIIGHNPALETLARWLCRDAPESLPTGGMLHISLPDVPWQLLEKHSAEQVSRLVPAEASHALFKKQTPKAPDLDEASLSQRILGLLNHYYRRVRALDPVRNKAFLAGLKRRQTLLGDLQDMCTRQAWVQAFIDAAGEASERRQACADWLAALEAEKQALREEIIALEPLARAEESLEH